MAENTVELPDNIIKFPQRNDGVEIPTTEEELTLSVGKIKNLFFEMVSLELAAPIFNRASLHGFDVSSDDCIKDCILVVESIKSLLLKSKGIHHEIQEYAVTNIDYSEDDMIFGNDFED